MAATKGCRSAPSTRMSTTGPTSSAALLAHRGREPGAAATEAVNRDRGEAILERAVDQVDREHLLERQRKGPRRHRAESGAERREAGGSAVEANDQRQRPARQLARLEPEPGALGHHPGAEGSDRPARGGEDIFGPERVAVAGIAAEPAGFLELLQACRQRAAR